MTRFEHVYVLNVMSDDHPGHRGGGEQRRRVAGREYRLLQPDRAGRLFHADHDRQPARADRRRRSWPSESAVRSRRGSQYQVLVRPAPAVGEARAPREPSDRFVITAFGGDQPGIVRRFSQYLAGKDINIVDLYGDRTGDEFVLIGQVEVPARWDIRMLQADLEQMGAGTGLHREAPARERLRGHQPTAVFFRLPGTSRSCSAPTKSSRRSKCCTPSTSTCGP